MILEILAIIAPVFNYLLAIRYRKSHEEVAGAVMVSTLPALLWFVLP